MSTDQNTKPPTPSDEMNESGSPSMQRRPIARRTWDYLQTDVDSTACNYVSIYACFLTGMTGGLSFSVSLVSLVGGVIRWDSG